jgi:hypothetical protein
LIGLNRENVDAILRGDVVSFEGGINPPPVLTYESDIVLLFAETDQDIWKRFPPANAAGVNGGLYRG